MNETMSNESKQISDVLKISEEIVASKTVKNLVYNNEFCVLLLIDDIDYPYSSTITPTKAEGIKKL